MLTKADIEKYFLAEKQTGLIFLIIGVIAILLAIAFFFYGKTSFYKGMAVPLIIFGLLEAIAGYTVYSRSDTQRIENVYAFDMNPGHLKDNEFPRMQKVMKNFVIYRWVEIVFIIAGLVLIFLFRSDAGKTFWYGFGIALAIQAVIMLGADYFAEKRGKVYTEELHKIIAD